jgi:hypothetical protein
MTIVRSQKLSPDAETILVYMSATRDAMDRHKRKIKSACHLSDNLRAEKAFSELTTGGYIADAGDGILDLTETGLQLGHSLKKSKSTMRSVTNIITNNVGEITGGAVNMTGLENGVLSTPINYESLLQAPTTGKLPATTVKSREVEEEPEIMRTARSISPDVPSIDSHPMRNGLPSAPLARGAKPVQPKGVAVRFLLAFDQPKNALAIPIVHGDIVGRSKKNSQVTVVLNHDEYVSNKHCKFEVAREKTTNKPALFVEDMGSRNGTYVDDMELYDTKLQLHHGSRLRIGNTTFIVVEIPY